MSQEELDAATAAWSNARRKLERAEADHGRHPLSPHYRQKLKSARHDFNLACLDRATAREKLAAERIPLLSEGGSEGDGHQCHPSPAD
jgi:hypothetical protein